MQAADLKGHNVKFIIDGCLEHLNKQVHKLKALLTGDKHAEDQFAVGQ